MKAPPSHRALGPSGRRDRTTHSARATSRWALRKAIEAHDRNEAYIDRIAAASSRHAEALQRFWAQQHLHKVKAQVRHKERQLLESTSLKDLIK